MNGLTKLFRQQTQKLEPPHKTHYAFWEFKSLTYSEFFSWPHFLRPTEHRAPKSWKSGYSYEKEYHYRLVAERPWSVFVIMLLSSIA